MRKQLTPEQTAVRDARRASFRKLAKTIADMPELDRIQMANKHGIRTIEGRELSLTNQCLLCMQLPGVSVVGGFRQWLSAGRAVMKGQHGAMIWVPIGRGKPASGGAEVIVEAVANESGERPGFVIGTVFDVSQTQEVEVKELQAA